MTGIAVVMDGGPERAETTVAALHHAAGHLHPDAAIDVSVVGTDHLTAGLPDRLDGLVVGPGSPYQRMDLVLEAIRSARERGLPLVGT